MAPHTIRCSEIWGGNRGDELDVETNGIRACLFRRPCDGGKGGDIYFFSVCGSDLLTRIAVADVVGHGEAVSETSGWVYESLAANMNSEDGTRVLEDTNRATAARGLDAMSTAVVAAYYRADGRFYYSYAGHHETLLLRAGKTSWERLVVTAESDELNGLPLGVHEDCVYLQQSVPCNVGDRVFLYTDGLTEAMDADEVQFGEERLLKVLNLTGGQPLADVRSSVIEALTLHAGEELGHDDVTFMILEIAAREN